MSHPLSLVLVLLIVPVVWSALIQLIRHVAGRKPALFSDRTEKTVIAIMLLPVATGLVFILISPLLTPLNRSQVFYPPVFDEVAQVAVKTLPRFAPQGPDLSALGAQAVLFIYLAGLGFTLWRLWQGHDRLARIVKTAHPTANDRYVLSSEASPLAFAWGARYIVIPSVLIERLTHRELELVLAHERAHQRRGDPAFFLGLSLIEAVFWFNPLFVRQTRACRLAAELACDAMAVGEGAQARKAYARTLLIALKYTNGCKAAPVPAFFSDKESYKMRLSQIMTASPRPRSSLVRLAAMCVLAAPVLMLQMAFAEGRKLPALSVVSAKIPDADTVQSGFIWHTAPVDAPVSALFGHRPDPVTGEPNFHSGVDFTVPIGTPVKTPASGTVTASAEWGRYGQIIEIDNGSGIRTRFAHLGKRLVHWGDRVSEGQVIALSGNTGQSRPTPHLHFEVWRDEKPVDPATIVALR
jgi:murein DD-endopeptidase MepM/ murein hydrolase activator NlpD/Zn-dependent protease with chaperone function